MFLLCFCGARANVVGNDTQIFNPTTSGIDFLTVQSSTPLRKGYLNIGLYVDYAKNVLPDTLDISGNLVNSNDSLSFTDLNFGYGLMDRVGLGLTMSYMIHQVTDREEPGAQFAKNGLNDVRGSLKLTLLERVPVGIALLGSVNFNQAKNNPFIGLDAGPTTNIQLVFDGEVGSNAVALNLGYRFRNPGTPISFSVYKPLSSEAIASVALSRYFSSLKTQGIFEVYGMKPESPQLGIEKKFAAEALIGAKYMRNPFLNINGGFGARALKGLFVPDYRIFVGVNIGFQLLESLAERNEAVLPREVVMPPAAPAPIKQVDVYTGFQPEEIKGLAKTDFEDIEKNHEFVLRRALPGQNMDKAKKPPFEVFRLDGFEFPFGSSDIDKKYAPMLKELVQYLNTKPQVLKIRVEGHTDSIGSEERNALRSASRAKAVKEYLVQHGLESHIKVDSIGYGSKKPIADNSEAAGRQQNRRVEVRILREIPASEVKTHFEQ